MPEPTTEGFIDTFDVTATDEEASLSSTAAVHSFVSRNANDTVFGLKISMIFVVFFLTLGGSYVPWIISPIFRKPRLVINIINVLTALAAGVILGSCFSHLVPDAIESWNDYFEQAGPKGLARSQDVDYPFAELIMVATCLALIFVDKCIVSRGLGGHSHGDGQGHSHMAVQLPPPKDGHNHKHSHHHDHDHNEDDDATKKPKRKKLWGVSMPKWPMTNNKNASNSHQIDQNENDEDEEALELTALEEGLASSSKNNGDASVCADACHDEHCSSSDDECCTDESCCTEDHTASPPRAGDGDEDDAERGLIAVHHGDDDDCVKCDKIEEGPAKCSSDDDDNHDDDECNKDDKDKKLAEEEAAKENDENGKEKIKRGSRSQVGRAWVFFFALSVHSIFDGLGVGAEDADGNFYALLAAVLAHKALDGFVLGIAIFFGDFRWWLAMIGFVFCALMTPLGIAISMAVTEATEGEARAAIEAFFLSMSAGSFLFISLVELLPASMEDGRLSFVKMLACTIGWGFMALIALWV